MKLHVAQIKWLMLGVGVILLISLGIFSWWNDNRIKRSEYAGNIMYQAVLSNANQEEMIKMLKNVADSDFGNYSYLAMLRLAAIYSEKDVQKAQSIYATLVNNRGVVSEIRELAEYLGAILAIKNSDPDLLKEKIKELTLNKHSVYSFSFKELIAVSMIKDNDINGAMAILKEVDNDFGCNGIVKKKMLVIY